MLNCLRSKTKFFFLFLMLIFAGIAGRSQTQGITGPKWWVGVSGAANFNHFNGSTRELNNEFTAPSAFHEGHGIKGYGSILIEYSPGKLLGGMLNLAYDNRGGKFKSVMLPCNCPAELTTNQSYFAVEPSLKLSPFKGSFYFFGGPELSFNLAKKFTYKEPVEKGTLNGTWSHVHSFLMSAQLGAGFDIPLSRSTGLSKAVLSPFVSWQVRAGHYPRTIETWSASGIRAGLALKFGTARRIATTAIVVEKKTEPVVVAEKEVVFTVRAPKLVPLKREVRETFPIRNSVFFDNNSTDIPDRYVLLSNSQAVSFREEQLQEDQPLNLNYGRSARQMAVYYNILNILGDRLRSNPGSMIVLQGSSYKDKIEGMMLAENVKHYLISVFGIDGSRISTEGREKPVIPSEKPGGQRELELLREGDRRVDIVSRSPELLMQIGGQVTDYLKPVEIKETKKDPFDSHVIFNVRGAEELLSSWSLVITDERGAVQNYGPFEKEWASVPGEMILAGNASGNYKVVMLGMTRSGKNVRMQDNVSLVKVDDPKQIGLRYSILFDFDISKSITAYENFLVEIIAPLIADNATVIIHGHTDIIGDEKHNYTLSGERATGAQQILERALLNLGRKGVKFETFGFGENESLSPFENNFAEKRFYNRTVIIDIVPEN